VPRSRADTSKRALARIQRLCCLGIGGEMLMPDLMREVMGLVPSRHGVFHWAGPNGEIVNSYSTLPPSVRDCRKFWGLCAMRAFSGVSFDLGDRVAWILRLVKIGAEGEGRSVDVMEIHRPDHLGNIADLGLALDEMKRLLAALQQEIVAAQVSDHALRRPTCSRCGGGCRVKDYQEHVLATLFGRVTIRLPRFRCAACCGSESGIDWPSHCRSTPELDRLQAHLAALMTYRTAADLLEQMFPVDAAKHPETLRRHALRVGEALGEGAAARPEVTAPAVVVTLDSTFIRS
jgi:hypothetical protein